MDRTRALLVASTAAHSSVASAARAMDADVVSVRTDGQDRMQQAELALTLDRLDPLDRARVIAVVATCGTTNAGVIDDLRGVAAVCERDGLWMHVDGAYGGAGLVAPSVRDRYTGIERADSFIVDPHKWLFAPFDCCALVYRDPSEACAAHTQHAEYLDVLHAVPDPGGEADWNPSDFAHHLSRRARGLPFWFSLATYGTDAYRDAIETTLNVARAAARLVDEAAHLELVMEPELSVVLFRRLGWSASDYMAWSDRMRADGTAFVVPTSWAGEPVLRICIVNPQTNTSDIELLVRTLAGD